ncbi:MAG: hypothetical protein RLZZ591_1348 [Pseudomonadota bacterium]|jgi:murein DD-endopeptidase MepM/ murein hydrolase activator NlpD
MHLIITDARFAKSRAVQFSGYKLFALLGLAALLLMMVAAGLYHLVFLKGAREGWPVVGTFLRFVVRDEFEQRDRYLRENLNVMAQKLGEIQAKLSQLESLGDRVSGLAGMPISPTQKRTGQGGALVSGPNLTIDQLNATLGQLELLTEQRTELMTVLESKLFEKKISTLMIPTSAPMQNSALGSPFGWRIDPFTGGSALHTGLDFVGEIGESILAAAGGVVVTQEFHPAYGQVVEIDHGNELITRYAHASKVHVKKGDLVKRGQKVAEVGSTGRSTGPHLHFEVLVRGVPQDPQKFLAAGKVMATSEQLSRVQGSEKMPLQARR